MIGGSFGRKNPCTIHDGDHYVASCRDCPRETISTARTSEDAVSVLVKIGWQIEEGAVICPGCLGRDGWKPARG